jgi:hypothetical protein
MRARCKNCHYAISIEQGWVCDNEESQNYDEPVPGSECCSEWMGNCIHEMCLCIQGGCNACGPCQAKLSDEWGDFLKGA